MARPKLFLLKVNNMSDIKLVLEEYSSEFNRHLVDLFELPLGAEEKTVQAMIYSITNGGKRLRPFLVYETARMFGVEFGQSFRVAAALEMVHSYSLIHDDLPAMDDDIMRRGKPTCHMAFDEATAILAGDGLLTYAFEVLADQATHSSADVRCKLIAQMASAAGAFDGMIAGQTVDLFAEKCAEKDEALIKHIEEMKTGRLLKYACEAGAILGAAEQEEYDALMKYARCIGMTFQISDDILDAEGDPALVGKTLNKDKDQGKVTFVTLYGIDEARKLEKELTDKAVEVLDIFGERAKNLKLLAKFIVERNY